MKRQLILLSACLISNLLIKAQQIFLDKVSVDYAKTVAVWPLIKELDPQWFEDGKDHMPKETVSYFNFTGDGNHSIFKRTKEAEIPKNMWFQPFADNNVVYNDYTSGTSISQKPIYEETFLVKDSLLKIKWKITADTRVIAGFECRKAIGILYDTVAIFAFYTDEIAISGGPEGINGLPGMILGAGIPRLHTTWFATKVEMADNISPKTLTPATKGKSVTRKSMLESLDRIMKAWEEWGRKMVLAFFV
jgi:GLPGLI family protein